MNKRKKSALEAAGFSVEDTADFLGLTEEEQLLVELRAGLAKAIRQRRSSSGISQQQAASKIKTTQPRFAKIEAAAPDVSLDQMFRGLFAVGGTVRDLIQRKSSRKLQVS